MEIILDGRLKTESSVVALGMFDGMHIGHRVLIRKARALADAAKAPLVVCTFMRHPLELIAPEKAPALLDTFEERAEILSQLGADYLYAMPFDHEVMNQLPECYVGELVRRFHPVDIVCGYNHSFGKQGRGSPALLEVLGAALGFRSWVVPKITYKGMDVSSTLIRQRLSRGEVSLAWRMLDRPYQRMGVIAEQSAAYMELVMPPNGKQTLPVGKYRVLISVHDKEVPTVLTIQEQGRGSCPVSIAASKHSEVKMSFLGAVGMAASPKRLD